MISTDLSNKSLVVSVNHIVYLCFEISGTSVVFWLSSALLNPLQLPVPLAERVCVLAVCAQQGGHGRVLQGLSLCCH